MDDQSLVGARSTTAPRAFTQAMWETVLPRSTSIVVTKSLSTVVAMVCAPSVCTSESDASAFGRKLVGIEGGVVSGLFNLESPVVGAPDTRP